MTLREIEREFGISYRTLQRWKHKKAEGNTSPETIEKRHLLLKVLTEIDISVVEKIKKQNEAIKQN